ncbi:hypothetical protein GCM10009682_63300 [Luedemannella flava]|uniref:PrgI family protein n=1 Tax=Luedemannella flava TaxID=349316 RepID=A0ABN2MUH1_9ACTN
MLTDDEMGQLRSRASYRVSVVTFRTGILAFLAFGIGAALLHTEVLKPIGGVVVIAAAVTAFVSMPIYFCAAIYLGISRSRQHRSVYNPRAQWQFTKAFTADLVRPLRRGRASDEGVT